MDYLIGQLEDDPEMQYIPNGTALVKFDIFIKDEEEIQKIIVWGDLAEACNMTLEKMSTVLVTGYFKARTWEYHGESYNKKEFVAKSVKLLEDESDKFNIKVIKEIKPEINSESEEDVPF